MRIQVIHAHPMPDSYNAALYRKTLDVLTGEGHEVVGTDLYAEGFEPRMNTAERGAYFTQDPLHAPDTAALIERLRWSEALVLCYPHWWFDMPAILKGYFDRVWLPGVAFHPDRAGGRIRPALTDIQKVVVVTSFGSPRWVAEWIVRNPARRTLRMGILMGCTGRVAFRYLAHYDMDRSTPNSRAAFMQKVETEMRRI